MKRGVKIFLGVLAVAVLCAGGLFIYDRMHNTDHGNYPYDPGTPIPDPHKGVFKCGENSLTFPGDDESVTIELSEEAAANLGLPAGKYDAKYEFLSGPLPPHGSVPVRYDVAHELSLKINGKEYVLDLAEATEDGKTATFGVDTVTPKRIPLLYREGDKYYTLAFVKE